MGIVDNIRRIEETLSEGVTLVAVSKTKPVEDILEAYRGGQRIFGENKVQEMCTKHEQLPQDIQWHLIGHLQSNKVKYIVPFVAMIHSIDSLELLRKVNVAARKAGRVVDCLLEVRIAEEDTKFGLAGPQAVELAVSDEVAGMENVRVRGLMGMASFTENKGQICREFSALKGFFDRLKEKMPQVDTLSMGMSGDYLLAVQCGSTMVRVGSSIFGERNYKVEG